MRKRQKCYRCVSVAFILLLFFALNVNLQAQMPSCWGDLKAGPYDIGFKTIEKYDYSRNYRPKYDYFGVPLEGERARPIQICIWYPAQTNGELSKMTYGEYVFPYPEDDQFFNLVSGLQDREINFLHFITRNNRGLVVDLMSAKMAAYKNAPGYEGSFPLIIYHPNLRASYCENAILCEYLASYGFVVATAHSLGLNSINPEEDAGSLETQIRDKEFIVSVLRDQTFIDLNKIGVMGYSQGGLAALIMQMRNSDVDAVVSLNGWFIIGDRMEFVRQCPFVSPIRMSVPLLQICTQEIEAYDFSLFDSLKYSDRYSLMLKGLSRTDFTHYTMFSIIPQDSASIPADQKKQGYEIICRYVKNFFDAQLNDKKEALSFINNSPQDNKIDPDFLAVKKFTKNELPPTREQFLSIVRGQGADKAKEIYDKFKKLDPGLTLFREATFNAIGYRLLFTGSANDAITIFGMNANAYPHSANTWDSLAEAHMNNGDNELAIKYYRMALEILASDTTTSEELKETIRNGAQQNIERLGG